MSNLTIKAPKGANKDKKCLGRGSGTGKQKTAGRGNKGQKSRSGGGTKIGFEGGQMPLYRRVAARGFSNYPFKTEYVTVNLGQLEERFEAGDTVTQATLVEKGLVKKSEELVKVLGKGELTKSLKIDIPCSKSVMAAVQKAGGEVLWNPPVTEEKEKNGNE